MQQSLHKKLGSFLAILMLVLIGLNKRVLAQHPYYAGIPIAYWDFENNANRDQLETSVEQQINPGNEFLGKFGSSSQSVYGAPGAGAIAFYGGNASGTGIQSTHWSTVTIDPGVNATNFFEFKLNTTGFTGITFGFDCGAGADYNNYPFIGVNYSMDGGNTWIAEGSWDPDYSIWNYINAVDMVAGADNNPDVRVRIYGYYGSNTTNSWIRLDNVVVLAKGMSPGAGIKSSLNEASIYTSTTSGKTGLRYVRFGNFTINSGATLDVGDDISLGNTSGTGGITVENGGTLDLGSQAPKMIYGTYGSFNLKAEGTIIIRSANAISSSGNTGQVQTNIRTFNTGGHYIYRPSVLSPSSQTTGSGLPATITGSLTIDNQNGVTLSKNTTVSGNLNFSQGVLNGGSYTLTAAGTLTGGSNMAYFKTNGTGALRRPVGGAPVQFPVGNNTYNPATLSNSGTADNFSVRVRDEVLSNGSNGPQVSAASFYVVNRTWDITEETPGGSIADVTLHWADGQYNTSDFDPAGVYLAHYTGGSWVNVGQGAASGANPYNFTATGISTFSPFTISSLASPFPLPVVLVDVQAANEGKRNRVEWQSASEDHLATYIVEKSTDGKTFTQMAEVSAKGKAAGYITYDNAPNNGLTYYRLKMVDQDGTIAYSKTVSAFMNGRGAFALQAAPNPTTGLLTITALGGNSSTAKVQITDVAGHVIAEVAMTDGKAEVNLSSVAAGVYFVKYADGQHSQTIKVTKQ